MKRLSGLPAAFWWLWVGSLVSAFATFVFPFLALYLTSRGLDARRTGSIVALLGVGGVIAGPLGGSLADHFGRKPTLLFALFTSAASAIYLGVVRSPLAIAPGVLVFGLGAAMSYPTVNAMVADVVSAGDAPRGYALLYWANNTGIAASAWVGGMLAGRSWLGLFTVDAVSTLAFAALVAARVPESRPTAQTEAGRGGWKSVLRDGPFVSFLLTHFAFMLVFWQFQFALPLAIVRAGLEPRTYGNAIAANCLFILVLQPLVARKLGGRDPGSLLAIASLSIGLGYGAYALCTTAWQFYAATLVWTVGDLVGLPLISAVVASMSPVDLRGRYQGAQMLAHSAAMVMAPLIAGALIEALGMNTLWTGCLALGTITAIAHFLLGAARKRRSPARHLPV